MHPETPKIKADKGLRAFRRECHIRWETFTEVWMLICEFVSAPCNDALFEPSNPVLYQIKLAELTNDILFTGNFGPESRGKWVFGQHSPEPHREAFTMFIERMVGYAVRKMNDISPLTGHANYEGFQSNRVGGWLTNAPWDQFRTMAPQIIDSEDSTFIITNSCASSTMVGNSDGSTTVADTVISKRSTSSGGTVRAETVGPK